VAPPFHQPTDVSIDANGDIFVSDGYRNSRVHKFSADGTLLKSIGEPGNAQDLKGTKDGPNLYHTPHGIWVHKDRVYVSDRENYRIQVYDRAQVRGDLDRLRAPDEDLRRSRSRRSCTSPSWTTASASSTWTAASSAATAASAATTRASSGARTASGRTPRTAIYISEVLGGARMQKFARVK
jgi:hypothetical protein